MPDNDELAKASQSWLSMEEACAYSGRSLATLKNWVSAGKISKRMVSMPGARDRAQLSRTDLDRAIGSPVHLPVVAEPSQTVELAKASRTELIPTKPDQAHLTLNGLAPVLARLAEIFPAPPAVQPHLKLVWSLREARLMTGLTEPALRELIARKPGLVIRHGRRLWVKAEGLRRELA